MMRFVRHIFAVSAACLMTGPASAQHVTSNVVGVDDAKTFARLCLDTAPSFVQPAPHSFLPARTEVEDGSRFGQKEVYEPFSIRNGYLEISGTGTSCTCSTNFGLSASFLDEFINNFHVTLQREFVDEFLSGEKDPTRILFDFDGVATEVSILARERSDGVLIISPRASREGDCAA